MRKYEIYKELIDQKLTVVIRGDSYEEAVHTAEACVRGGIQSLEITFTIPQADEVIRHFADRDDVLVGAGSVLDAETAKLAIHAGARFVVGPNFNKETSILCNRYQIPYIPGCMTVNETVAALESGASIVKLFPGQAFSPSHIKAVKGPIPQVEVMPTGGVSLDNVQEWLKAGAIMVGIGGDITKPGSIGDYEAVKERAKAYVQAVKECVV
ncbi:bifunctional 2-keto-4-hydroxyglutarate aldolase/2-keto-3-deoxy-6-phosphogluconate aldolase [Halobacillus sp. KGW1]|uniref:bifunctional 2-keto-4-hydroxyglutarate aldolase/2-keto-3-deoxy-6-phosphogluconate aldolase n=1 Tax=Halobacillus sp. KGW1 TaxID=1793726 RepID=UPI000785B34A|nr:bifunctional 2-keto-4-hydroxyglutarate aldolase/2-keto-3-deoxy-6-phosphogluconate aldolase [Halobacillus sp. KGW1]